MSLVNFAKSELAIINTDHDEMQNEMDKCLIEIVEKFAEQGHSGFSANYTIRALTRLLKFKPLTALTGEDDEWNEVSDGLYQNRRCGEVFKKDGRAYWMDGKVFSNDGGETWYTSRESRVYIDEFPYYVPDKPESVLIDQC